MSLEVRGQLVQSNSRTFLTTTIYMLSVTDLDPKGTISEVRVPGHIWTYWMLADCQMQSEITLEIHRWNSKLTARHLQTLQQDIF